MRGYRAIWLWARNVPVESEDTSQYMKSQMHELGRLCMLKGVFSTNRCFMLLFFNILEISSKQISFCCCVHISMSYLLFPLLMLKCRKPKEQTIPTTAIIHMIIIRGNGIIINSRYWSEWSLGGLLPESMYGKVINFIWILVKSLKERNNPARKLTIIKQHDVSTTSCHRCQMNKLKITERHIYRYWKWENKLACKHLLR